LDFGLGSLENTIQYLKSVIHMDSWQGTVVNVFIAPEAAAAMQAVEAAHAVPGKGLEGDRYFDGNGAFSRWPGPHREVTLIAEEGLAAMAEETGIAFPAAASRRNVLVRGVPLNDLVDRTFQVGEVRMRGIRLAQPCKYLARISEEPAVLPGLVNRGGLRARILTAGTIRVGDVVEEAGSV